MNQETLRKLWKGESWVFPKQKDVCSHKKGYCKAHKTGKQPKHSWCRIALFKVLIHSNKPIRIREICDGPYRKEYKRRERQQIVDPFPPLILKQVLIRVVEQVQPQWPPKQYQAHTNSDPNSAISELHAKYPWPVAMQFVRKLRRVTVQMRMWVIRRMFICLLKVSGILSG